MADQMQQQPEGDIFHTAQSGDIATVKKFLDEGAPVDLTDEEGWSLLHHAAALGQVDIINLLRDNGCHVDMLESEGRTPLHYAATNGDIETIRLLIAMGSNVNSVDYEGNTPLKWSVMCEQNAAIEELTKLGGTVDIEGGSKYSPYNKKQLYEDVFEAARCGNTATILSYLNSGAPVDLTDKNDRTLLHCAAGEGQIKVVELLIKRGCRIYPVDKNKCTPLDYATACGHVQTVQLLKQLLNEPWEEQYFIDRMDNQGRSVLHFAAGSGDIHVLESILLVEHELDVNIGDDEGMTPLHYAATYGQIQSVLTLLRLGGRESMTKIAGTHGTPLHRAVAGGHKDIVSLLLIEGCPINVVNSRGRSVLHFAAQYGELHIMEMLVEQGLDVNDGDDEGWTPFHDAANCGQLESVCTLLRLGGRESMTKVAGTRGTPLHQAVGKGHKDIVSLLLNEGCPINVVNSRGRSVLHFAAQYGKFHMMEMLVEQGLDVNIAIGDDEGWTPLHDAAACGQLESVYTLLGLDGRESMTKVAGTRGTPLHQAVGKGHKDIASLLLNEGCPINVVNSRGRSVLHFAAQYGKFHMIEMLVEQGLDVNIGDDVGWTPFHDAATCGQLESVCTLLRLGGRESMTKVAGNYGTPLHQAVVKGHKDIVSLLLNKGCPINVVDSEGASVLLFAAQGGHIHMIEMLAEQGLDVNIGDDKGWSPLYAAAACGHLESVRILLRLGGRESMTKMACDFGTPLHQAVAGGHKDVVSLMWNEGCPINVVGNEGITLFHWTAQFGCSDIIEMLSEKGLDVNISDNKGRTPLHYAADRGHVTTFKELVSIGGNIHLKDDFGMKFSDWALIGQSFVTIKQFCVACGLECDEEGFLGVLSALSANNLLDMNRILCLAALGVNVSIFDAMVTSSYPLNEQKMFKIVNILSFKSGGKKLPDQFHVSEEPLNPLHISILTFFFNFSQNIKFIEKLTSHPRTRYTVNELFPNGLSPLDVARRFELHDIADIIERAGGGPGAWADFPKEIEDKSIDIIKSLKELTGSEFGKDATSRIIYLLGYQLFEGESVSKARKKVLGEKPVFYLLEKHFILHIKSKGKWKRVGRLLKVDEDALKRISEEAVNDDDAYYFMLEYWLEHGRNVSWKTLLDAVGHFETKKTVDDITDKIVEELSQVSIQSISSLFKLRTCVVLHVQIYTTTLLLRASQQFPYTCNVCMVAFTGMDSMHLSFLFREDP